MDWETVRKDISDKITDAVLEPVSADGVKLSPDMRFFSSSIVIVTRSLLDAMRASHDELEARIKALEGRAGEVPSDDA